MKTFRNHLLTLMMFSGVSAFAKPMTATLSLTERIPIKTLAANVLDPNSERFQIYYTPEEIRELVAPNDSDYALLLENLSSEGFSIVFESKTHLLVTIKGDHKDFEKNIQNLTLSRDS